MTHPTQAPGPARTIYASFLLGDEEFALDVKHVQEVINLPSSMVEMPLGPEFSLGIFNLRNSIIPLLSTAHLLGMIQHPLGSDAKVVIVHHLGIRLGLACDATGRVLRPRGEELTLFSYQDQSTHPIVAGVLKLADTLVRVLDLDRLITLENVPHPEDTCSINAAMKARLARKKCITFRVGRIHMAFPIGSIHEIVRAKGIEPSPVKDPLCEGLMHIRQEIVPVVRFSALLGLPTPPQQETDENEDERVMVLEVDKTYIGLLVDAVESIDIYTEDQVMQVPVLSSHRAGLFTGCIAFKKQGHVLLLNSEGVFEQDEISRITGQHSALFSTQQPTTQVQRRHAGSRLSFLWFKAGPAFAMPMREVREIVDCTTGLIEMPGAPHYICGMLNLRGKLVTVVDIRQFYQLAGTVLDSVDGDKVLVIDHGDTLIGLRVDTIESILHIYPEDMFPVPHVMRGALAPAVRNDVSNVVRVPSSNSERPIHLLVLDVNRVVSRVATNELPQDALPHV